MAVEQRNLAAALWYASKGWRVIFSPARTKFPVLSQWQKCASTNPELIVGWFRGRPELNVNIVTGEESGLFVLDVDVQHGGADTLSKLEKNHGALPQTFTVQTGGGGFHFYFAWPGIDIRNSASKLGPGLDIRAAGGQVVAAPSISALGSYNVLDWAPLADAPEWLLSMLRVTEPPPGSPGDSRNPWPQSSRVIAATANVTQSKASYVLAALRSESDAVRHAANGSRNHRLNEAAYKLGTLWAGSGIDGSIIAEALRNAARDAGLTASETETTIRSGFVSGMNNPRV